MRWLLLLLSVLLMSISTSCENSRAAGGWWRYGLSGSSPFWHELHAYDEDPTQDQTMIAALTLFADEKRAVHHLLENDGRGKTVRGTLAVGFRRTPAEISEAMALLSVLQPGGPYPAPEKLVILRWYQDGKWVMARFDRSALPDEVQSLATIISGRPVGDIEP